jgi:hypothetical protein
VGPAARAVAALLVVSAVPLPETGAARWASGAAIAPALLVGVGAPGLTGVLAGTAGIVSCFVLAADVAAVGAPTGAALVPAWTQPAGWFGVSLAAGTLGGLATRGHGGRTALGLVALVVAALATAAAWEAAPATAGAASLARLGTAWSLPALVALPGFAGPSRADRVAGAREGLGWLTMIVLAGPTASGWAAALLAPVAIAAWTVPASLRVAPARGVLALGAIGLAFLTFPGIPADGASAGWAAAVFVAIVWRVGLADSLPEAS